LLRSQFRQQPAPQVDPVFRNALIL
jgi:hypothetical protein